MCKSKGMASTARYMLVPLTPSKTYARIRARLWGAPRCCVSSRYRRAHCCKSVAESAEVRLRTKLRNHRMLTLMAELVGLNDALLAAVRFWERVSSGTPASC